MGEVYLGLALFLLLTIGGGLIRVLLGPTLADRMLAAQLFGTVGVAILLLLAKTLHMPKLLDVALIFALLSLVATVAFVRHIWIPPKTEQGDHHERW